MGEEGWKKMSDLISRGKLFNLLAPVQTLGEAYGIIQGMDTVDAVPVRHGRWVHHPEIGWGSTWLCSECGEKTVETIMGEPRDKFCPMCGARMDGDHHE